MAKKRSGLDEHVELVPHFATRAEIAELREKVMSLQTIVRAIAEKQGADPDLLDEWTLCMGQFSSEPGRALATAQRAAVSLTDRNSASPLRQPETTSAVAMRPAPAAGRS
jgi:hypothetical protein